MGKHQKKPVRDKKKRVGSSSAYLQLQEWVKRNEK